MEFPYHVDKCSNKSSVHYKMQKKKYYLAVSEACRYESQSNQLKLEREMGTRLKPNKVSFFNRVSSIFSLLAVVKEYMNFSALPWLPLCVRFDYTLYKLEEDKGVSVFSSDYAYCLHRNGSNFVSKSPPHIRSNG